MSACENCGDPSCTEYKCIYRPKKTKRQADPLYDILVDNFNPRQFDATDAVLMDRTESVARSQWLAENDPSLQGNRRADRAATIGARVRLTYRPDWRKLGLTAEWADEFAEFIECLWMNEMEDPENCWNDATGMQTVSGQLGLLYDEWGGSGESLGVFTPQRDPDNRPFDFGLNVIDTARLITPAEFRASGSVKEGVRVTREGRPTKWYVADEHPHAMYKFSYFVRQTSKGGIPRKHFKSYTKQYSWGKPRLFHYFSKERAGQNRAKPHMAAAFRLMKGAHQLTDIHLQAAYRDALNAIWLQSDDPNASQAFSADRAQDPAKTFKSLHLELMKLRNMANEVRPQMSGQDLLQLMAGESINALRSQLDHAGHKTIMDSFFHHFGRAAEVDTASWSGDMSGQSFSTIRAGIVQTLQSRRYKAHGFLQGVGTPIFSIWFEEKIARGDIKMPGVSSNRTLRHLDYFYRNRRALTMVDFASPGVTPIDEVKAEKAWTERLKTGRGSLSQYLREHTTMTPRELADEISRDKRIMEQHPELREALLGGGLNQQANDRVTEPGENDEDE